MYNETKYQEKRQTPMWGVTVDCCQSVNKKKYINKDINDNKMMTEVVDHSTI